MNYTIRIKRQENPQASPCWQEFSFEGSADISIASVLNELNHRSPLCEKSGTVVSPIAWECGCMIRKCGACAMRINGLPRLACSVFLRDCKGSVVTLEPLSKFPLVKDLVVDRSVIFEALKRTKLWLEGDPVLTFFMPAGGGLLAGPIYLLLIAKVHKRWSLSIMGVIMGIIWFVTGMHWAFALGYLIMAIVADFVAGAGQYKSKKLNSLSYILFSLGGTGSYIVFFVDPNGWAQTMLGNGTEQSYIDTMQATANTGILIAMFAAVIITSAISAFVGCKMLKKQFEKAGITA